ncbi:MAG: XdhC family protein, partial [Candidatus Wallbacteria bacterium]|nr:XdhC family protein [Candidatus Wallbacteria bacterium]
MSATFGLLLDAIRQRRPVCLVVLVAPAARAGARMVLAADGVLVGELPPGPAGDWLRAGAAEALAASRTLTLTAPPEVEADLEAYFEPYPPRPGLVILGGGHVGKALYDLAAPFPIFDLTVVDDRPAYANETRFPIGRTVCCDFADTFGQIAISSADFIVIVTRGHRADKLCLRAALGTNARYIGMIGSKRKVLLTYQHLRD